jgi:hypothetical protein
VTFVSSSGGSEDLARQQPAGESGGEPLAILARRVHLAGREGAAPSRAGRAALRQWSQPLPAGPPRGAYLYVDRPPPKSLSRSMRSLFTGRRAQVLHGLLVRHQDWFGVKDLAEQALVSPRDGVPGAHRDGALRRPLRSAPGKDPASRGTFGNPRRCWIPGRSS